MCERLFSLVTNIWTDKKSRLSMDTLKNWLEVKFNIEMSCEEFASFIQTKEDVLKKVKSVIINIQE